MLVQQFLERSAERLPDKTCLVCDGRRLTYAEVEAQANRLANVLREAGFRRGDRAVIYLPNSVEAVVAIFAEPEGRRRVRRRNASTKEAKLAYVVSNCGAARVHHRRAGIGRWRAVCWLQGTALGVRRHHPHRRSCRRRFASRRAVV